MTTATIDYNDTRLMPLSTSLRHVQGHVLTARALHAEAMASTGDTRGYRSRPASVRAEGTLDVGSVMGWTGGAVQSVTVVVTEDTYARVGTLRFDVEGGGLRVAFVMEFDHDISTVYTAMQAIGAASYTMVNPRASRTVATLHATDTMTLADVVRERAPEAFAVALADWRRGVTISREKPMTPARVRMLLTALRGEVIDDSGPRGQVVEHLIAAYFLCASKGGQYALTIDGRALARSLAEGAGISPDDAEAEARMTARRAESAERVRENRQWKIAVDDLRLAVRALNECREEYHFTTSTHVRPLDVARADPLHQRVVRYNARLWEQVEAVRALWAALWAAENTRHDIASAGQPWEPACPGLPRGAAL